MSKSDLSKATKEYKKYLTQWAGDGKTFLLNEEVSLKLKKFNLSKNNNQVFLRSDFTFSLLHAMNVPMNLIILIKNDHLLLIVSVETIIILGKHKTLNVTGSVLYDISFSSTKLLGKTNASFDLYLKKLK